MYDRMVRPQETIPYCRCDMSPTGDPQGRGAHLTSHAITRQVSSLVDSTWPEKGWG